MVQCAARSGNHDVDAALKAPELPSDRRAAVDGEHPRAQGAAVAVDCLGDLDGEFARRDQDQCDGHAPVAVGAQALEYREGECGGLAGASGGLAEQIAALDKVRDRFTLDGSGLLVPQSGDSVEQLRP